MIVTLTSTHRPEYLRQSLQSWVEAERSDEITFLIHQEPTAKINACKHVVDETLGNDFSRAWFVNSRILGPLNNPYSALKRAYSLADGEIVVLAEDDAIVSKDIVNYFEWGHQQTEGFVCAFQGGSPESLGYGSVSFNLQERFSPTIWSASKHLFDNYLDDTWQHDYLHKGWDWYFNDYVIPHNGIPVLVPEMSRSQHIGEYGGAHCTPEMFEALKAPRFLREGSDSSEWRII